jgi:hypothetical protein
VDSDAVFLRNPAEVLAPQDGFIASCGHWHNTGETVNEESTAILKTISTCWQRNVFNAGQFACSPALYTEEELKRTCLDPRYVGTCLRFPYHDQPGMVLLVNLSGVVIRNLTLPPTCMESTWAEDYDGVAHYEDYWRDEARTPYLIHWAGCDMWEPRAIDQLFTRFFNANELEAWKQEVAEREWKEIRSRRSLHQRLRNIARGLRKFAAELQK